MIKPTGRPRGRPKTKENVTLLARMPRELAEQVRKYAAREQQSVSEVLRSGLLLLLDYVHERKTLSRKPATGLPGTLFFGCHQCQGDVMYPVQWVGFTGKTFVFCDNDCLREWIDKGEERIVREIRQEYEDEEEVPYDSEDWEEDDDLEEEDSVSPDDLPVRS